MAQDRSLMERLHRGDATALDELLQRYWRPLVLYASRFVDGDTAEDVVQEAMLRIWHQRTEWTPSDRIQGFLYQITRNLALNERDRRTVRDRWSASQLREPRDRVPTPLDDLQRQELAEILDRVIQELPPRRRETFVLSRYHGLSYGEIAEIMDVSPQTVANQMSAALDDLRTRLRPQIEAYRSRTHLRVIDSPDGPDTDG